MSTNVGLIVGRFQPVHLGHIHMIEKAADQCRTLCIGIGSAQESRTEKNPFNYAERIAYLTLALHDELVSLDNIKFFPLYDIGIGNNSDWGQYVLQQCTWYTGYQPNIIFSGIEARRTNWFENNSSIQSVEMPKYKDFHATDIRTTLKTFDWKNGAYRLNGIPIGLATCIPEMQRTLNSITEKETASI